MSAGGSGKLFSSDGEWSAKSDNTEERQKKAEVEEAPQSTSSIVSSGTLSDPDQERNYVRGFAQRAAEPDIKQIRAKGPHTYLKKSFQEGENYYEKERQSRQEHSPIQGRSSAKMPRPDSPISPSGMDDYDGDEDHDRYSRSSSARAGQSMMPEPSEYRPSYPDDEEDYPPRQPRRSALAQKRASRVSYDTEKYSDAGSGEYNDVSNWGHEADSDHGMSMSSGISPRESRPRERKFDPYQATQALAWAGEKYTQAQIMRREGTAPEHYGVVEDMPTRMAYEQLNVLAGMAGKVQHVIEHNRKVFERRVMAADKAELSRAFQAWRAVRYGSVRKQQLLQRAVNKIARGALSRAFLAWKDKFAIVDKFLLMKRKGIAVNRMGRMRRAFKEWRVLVHERWWKDQMITRDHDIERLNRLCRKYENRPVTILGNRRLRSCIWGWYDQAWERIRHRQLLAKAAKRMTMRQLSSAWNTWFEEYDRKRTNKQHLQRTIGRLLNNKLSRAWGSWVAVIGTKERKRLRLAKGLKFWENQSMGKGWNAWLDLHEEAKKYKKIFKHWKNGQMAKAWFRWVEFVDTRIRQRIAVGRAITKMLKKNLFMAFDAWVNAIEEGKWVKTTSAKEALHEEVVRLRAENERLRRDNERFVRLIDSGEWGRGRVAELVQAGEVMKGERDALMKLIGSLRREYEAVQEAKAAQESELGDLKRRITNVGGAGRNRLLVKGGSSFNGLVRQMKQEMADAAAAGAPMDPNRLYEVNRLSMDQVQVFPDGELGVRGVDTVSARKGRFSIPIPVSGKKSPVKRMNVPAALQGMQGHGRSPGGSPLGYGGVTGRQGMSALEDRIATATRRKPGVVATME